MDEKLEGQQYYQEFNADNYYSDYQYFCIRYVYIYTFCTIGIGIGWLVTSLKQMHTGSAIVLGLIIVGAMTAIDMGGPINKTAATALLLR